MTGRERIARLASSDRTSTTIRRDGGTHHEKNPSAGKWPSGCTADDYREEVDQMSAQAMPVKTWAFAHQRRAYAAAIDTFYSDKSHGFALLMEMLRPD